ncbi:hypothetical protein HMPREF3034_00007 [Prevotella sp. DNF00663]|nr:hypothetical protein HMPREF3034_00007 [Prevotella sp. DNF00663]
MFHFQRDTVMKINEHNEKVLEKFATMIIERMKQMKAGQWKKGWVGRTLGGPPSNIEGKYYQGSNVFLLMLDCAMHDYELPVYCTLRQANKLGAHINKGEESMPVIFWDYSITTPNGRKITLQDYLKLSIEKQAECTKFPFLKSYHVFNIAQTNLTEKHPDKVDEFRKVYGNAENSTDTDGMYDNIAIDSMLANESWLCPIEYTKPSDGAYYQPKYDRIVVPMKSQFKTGKTDDEIYKDGQEFYACLLHEMVHSTGIESRLNRQRGKRFGDKLYAKEELVAELGAARIGQALGFDKRILDNNAAYLDCWIAGLQQEPTYVLTLLSDVEKASKMILEKIA